MTNSSIEPCISLSGIICPSADFDRYISSRSILPAIFIAAATSQLAENLFINTIMEAFEISRNLDVHVERQRERKQGFAGTLVRTLELRL